MSRRERERERGGVRDKAAMGGLGVERRWAGKVIELVEERKEKKKKRVERFWKRCKRKEKLLTQ